MQPIRNLWLNKITNKLDYGIILFIIYVSISQVVLPAFGREHFYFLATWALFQRDMPRVWNDISAQVDGKTVYLSGELGARLPRTTVVMLQHVLNAKFAPELAQGKISNELSRLIKEEMLAKCACTGLRIVRLRGSLAAHLFKGVNPEETGIAEVN